MARDLARVVVRERLELDPPSAAASPTSRAAVRRAPARRADEQETCLGALDHVLDELEERRFGPVDVLEEHDERSHRCEPLEELASPPVELLHRERLLREPDRRRDARDTSSSSSRAPASVRVLRRVALGDPRGLADGLGERPERDAVAVREAAAAQDHGLPLDRPDELVDQPRLADAGLADDGHEPRPVSARLGKGVAQDCELAVAADHGRVEAPRALAALDSETSR